MDFRIVVLLTLIALAPQALGRNVDFWRLFDEPADKCSVFPDDRNDCGWYGIDEYTCERRECCYDDTYYGYDTKYCFYPTDDKCYGIVPEERKDCGYNGIQREQCENELRCCFDHTVPGVPWCFKGNEELTEEPTEEDRKCDEIIPDQREDCGYYGIERKECEDERGCCYDETVPDVPWCFKGSEPTEGPIEEEHTEGLNEGSTEEPTEESTEEPVESSAWA